MIVSALQQLLQATPEIAARLAVFDFGDGTKRPAVFTQKRPPRECGLPYVTIELHDIDNWAEGRDGGKARQHTLEIRVWGEEDESPKGLRALATLMWEVMYALTPGQLVLPAKVTQSERIAIKGPSPVESDDGFPGYDFQLEVRIIDRR